MSKLSIVVPIYNSEKNLSKCLDSILNQTLTDWECFLIDDGSSDRSSTICDYYSIKDSRFKVIHKYNSGPGDTRNLGIYLSSGEWLGFVDSDDWIEPDRYKIAIEKAEVSGSLIVQCAINVYKNNNLVKVWHLGNPGVYRTTDKRIFSNSEYDIGHCWDKIYKTSFIKENHIKFPDCDLCEDTLFNTHAYFTCGKILSISDRLYNYVITDGSLAHSNLSNERKIHLIRSSLDFINNTLSGTLYFDRDLITNFFDNALCQKSKNMIDYVFPYVDNNDTAWQEDYIKYKGEGYSIETNGLQRFRSNENLLKYKFRAIEKWMPWIGTIHMIVSSESQIPNWINRDKVHIVYHKDFIPEEFLPTFNSTTIEMFLHNIYGLSERFVYSNDDMYPNNVIRPKFYFTEDTGKLRSDLHVRKLWKEGDINQVWAQIPINALKLAAKDTPEYLEKYVDGKTLWELQHVGKPMFRLLNKQAYEKYKTEINESITQFRDAKNINQYFYIEYALFHGFGVFETFRNKYFQVGYQTEAIINEILETDDTKRARAICCNDTDACTDDDFKKIEEAFSQVYPFKCKYEL